MVISVGFFEGEVCLNNALVCDVDVDAIEAEVACVVEAVFGNEIAF